jgi:cell shape-determining protein MreD
MLHFSLFGFIFAKASSVHACMMWYQFVVIGKAEPV